MKKILFMIIIAAFLISTGLINQGYCGEKVRRVLRNCGVQEADKIDNTMPPCEHLDGFTNVALWPGQALVWDEMVYFTPEAGKLLTDFLGFVTSCNEITIRFNDELIKKHCIRNGRDEEMLYVIYSRKYILELVEDDGFLHVEIKNISKNIISVIIKRVESPEENNITYLCKNKASE